MKSLTVGIASLLIGLTSVSGLTQSARNPADGKDVQNQFVGAWRLAWLEQPGSDGKLRRIDCCGMLIYTRDGHMSVQVMDRNPPTQTSTPSEQYSQGGYEASYGTYTVDERSHAFTFHVEGALVRNVIGKDLPRSYEFSGNLLVVKSTNPDEHWRVAWERY